MLLFFFLLGYVRIYQTGNSASVKILDGRLEEEENLTAKLAGRVVRIELRDTGGKESFRLLLSDCSIQTEGKTETEETELFFVGGVLLFLDELPEGVREGRKVFMEVRLSEMEASGNPGQFDSRSYYRGQGIFYLAKGTACLEVSGKTDYLRMSLRLLRQYFSENLLRTAGEQDGGMLCAMVLGKKWEADGETVSLYTESGMGHLLAVSGLHISLAGMGMYRLLRKKLKCSYALAAVGCTAMSFCYYLLAGEGTSVGRAFFMLTVYGVGQALGRQYDLASAAALAALAMLIGRPFLLLQSGFLLSFGSVLALGILYPLFSKARFPGFISIFLPGFSIQMATLPVQAYFFFKFPVYSLLLNLAVLPLFTAAALLGIAGALFGGVLPGVLSVVLLPARGILRLYEFLGEQSLRLPGALWRTGRPKLWQLLLYGALLLLLCRRMKGRAEEKRRAEIRTRESRTAETRAGKNGRRSYLEKAVGRWLWGGLILGGMVFCLTPVRYRGMELVFLDVGQGDGCFLRTAEGITFLIDGGSSDEPGVGEYRLEPFLDFQGVGQVDFVLASHGDRDHINGICGLMEAGRVGTLILPRGRENGTGLSAMKEQAEQSGIPVLSLSRGEQLAAGEAVFTCLWPEAAGGDGSFLDENEASMVLWLSWRELDVLFTGDLEGRGETAVTSYLETWKRVSGRAAADILKVPHHGSGGAGSINFLEAAAPKYGIISCGKNNRYGHPAKEALERLSDAGCQVFRTDQDGAVTVRSDGGRMEISGYK